MLRLKLPSHSCCLQLIRLLLLPSHFAKSAFERRIEAPARGERRALRRKSENARALRGRRRYSAAPPFLLLLLLPTPACLIYSVAARLGPLAPRVRTCPSSNFSLYIIAAVAAAAAAALPALACHATSPRNRCRARAHFWAIAHVFRVGGGGGRAS